MTELPEKIGVRSGVLVEVRGDRFQGLSTEAVEAAAHRYNIHKRLVDAGEKVCDSALSGKTAGFVSSDLIARLTCVLKEAQAPE